uniref:Uncharacterized protein n=1 Tax=Aegilops tauschii subsp. strangulata TaxID=200361 RepID=A0A453KI93_AEGTS
TYPHRPYPRLLAHSGSEEQNPQPDQEGSHWTGTRSNPLLSLHSSKFVSKRTACLIATGPSPAATEEPEMDLPKEIFLKDYKKPDYLFDTVDLEFQLGDEKTMVTSKIAVSPGNEGEDSSWELYFS